MKAPLIREYNHSQFRGYDDNFPSAFVGMKKAI
jgi:hypothetical protein